LSGKINNPFSNYANAGEGGVIGSEVICREELENNGLGEDSEKFKCP